MIVYLDASALVKRYVVETGSEDVGELIDRADAVGTAILSRVEVAAALAKGARMKLLSRQRAAAALRAFYSEWDDIVRLQMTEVLVARASALAWEHELRGYDAAHLAAALFWQDMLGESVALATYDRQLWAAAEETGLVAWPRALPD